VTCPATTINVTAQHLTRGIPGDCAACAVALAVKDAFPQASNVTIGQRYVSMYHEGQWLLPVIPLSVGERIAAIDRGRAVEPFSFDLDYPAEVAA
jgi:hypothetical protein